MEKQVIENVLIYLNGEPKRVDITIYPRVEGNNRNEERKKVINRLKRLIKNVK